jgi:hypothetical protein
MRLAKILSMRRPSRSTTSKTPASIIKALANGWQVTELIESEARMLNQGKVIMCAISTAAMDDIEGRRDVRPDQRVDQFMSVC